MVCSGLLARLSTLCVRGVGVHGGVGDINSGSTSKNSLAASNSWSIWGNWGVGESSGVGETTDDDTSLPAFDLVLASGGDGDGVGSGIEDLLERDISERTGLADEGGGTLRDFSVLPDTDDLVDIADLPVTDFAAVLVMTRLESTLAALLLGECPRLRDLLSDTSDGVYSGMCASVKNGDCVSSISSDAIDSIEAASKSSTDTGLSGSIEATDSGDGGVAGVWATVDTGGSSSGAILGVGAGEGAVWSS